MSFAVDHLLAASAFAVGMAVLYLCTPRRWPALRHALLLAALLRFVAPIPWLAHVIESTGIAELLASREAPAMHAFAQSMVWTGLSYPPAPRIAGHSVLWLSIALLWAAGALFLLALQVRRALSVWRLVRRSTRGSPPAVLHPLRAYESDAVSRPGLYGIWSPVVLLPAHFTDHLSNDELGAILIHETAHYRRRDNWAGLLEALAAAVYWFHPLVWWINRRLVDERELACDAAVIEAGVAPNTYVTALSKACRFSIHAAVDGIPAAGGSNLEQRMETIMSGQLETSARPWERAAGRAVLLSTILAGLVAAFLSAQPATALAQSTALAQQRTPASPTPYTKWLNEDVLYLVSDMERQAFERLGSNAEREKFIEQFWLRRDPTPGTAQNELKEEHYRRIAYANERFGGKLSGWRTPRGRIYIVFGPPHQKESHPAERFEKWRYNEGMLAGMILEFRDLDLP